MWQLTVALDPAATTIMTELQPEIYTLFCVLLGENSPFAVEIAKDETVDILKKLIKKEKEPKLNHIDADELTLYKVEILDDDYLVENTTQRMLEGLSPLKPTLELVDYFTDTPKDETIHIIVQVPAGLKRKASTDIGDTNKSRARRDPYSPNLLVAAVDSFTAQRSVTVEALYERLNKYHLVMVRGTPASGKSTLAQLLEIHIRSKEPDSDPILVYSWPRYASNSNWLTNLTKRFNRHGPNICIIDSAQASYWDNSFWNGFLKTIRPESKDRVILFANHGSPNTRVSVEGTSMILPNRYHISLRPVDHEDGVTPAGLLLMPDEFTDMVQKKFPAGRFKKDFPDYVTRVTAGHVGAVEDLLRGVLAHQSYNQLKSGNEEYSLEIFWTQFPISEFWKALNSRGVFRRGLPVETELRDLNIARVLRVVLSNHNVTKQQVLADEKTLDQCFQWGWLHATMDQDEINYIFATPLHQWFVEYYLGTRISDPTLITDQGLSDFAFNVIRRFSHIKLPYPRKIGASNTQRPLEAQFQDEFYRCCYEYSNGCLVSFPDFGNADARIDLYIPSKNWGMELLRDGEGLENHSSRFMGPGAYAKMEFIDYIILDFRKTQPQKTHPGIPKLYHVIFEKDYSHVCIRNGSSLETVTEFVLLN